MEYLLGKKGIKGSEISYTSIEMSEYLQPYNRNLTVEQKQEMFAVRNRMVNIPGNFGTKTKCECGKNEDMSHIYECELLCDNKEHRLKFSKIFNGSLQEQVEVFNKFSENMKTRENILKQRLPMGQSDSLSCTEGDL